MADPKSKSPKPKTDPQSDQSAVPAAAAAEVPTSNALAAAIKSAETSGYNVRITHGGQSVILSQNGLLVASMDVDHFVEQHQLQQSGRAT
jgi:hypothetical protein